MLTPDFASSVTVRSRVAFVLTVAERVLKSFDSNSEGVRLAESAFDAAWSWQSGEEVSGGDLYNYLEDENDSGLFVIEGEAEEEQETAWVSVTNAIAYVARCAYNQVGDQEMASPLWEVSDDTVAHVADFAIQCNVVDERWIQSLAEFFLESGATDDPTTLGESFDRKHLASWGMETK